MGYGDEYLTGNGFDLVENDSPRRSGGARASQSTDQARQDRARAIEGKGWGENTEDWGSDTKSGRLLYGDLESEGQEVKFGFGIFNTYGNGRIGVHTKKLDFKDCYTFGYEESKFSGGKGTMSLCLNPSQLDEFKHVVGRCEEALQRYGYGDHIFKTGLYKDKIYVKVEESSSQKDIRNSKLNAKVEVRSIYLTNEGMAYLQLYLTT